MVAVAARRVLVLTLMIGLTASCSWVARGDRSRGVVGDDELTVRGEHGRATVHVPPGAASEGTVVSVNDQATAAASTGTTVTGTLVPLSEPVEVSAGDGQLRRKARIELSFDPARLPPGAVGTDVFAARFEPQLGTWLPVASTVDVPGHRVQVQTAHFSKWQVFGWNDDKLRAVTRNATKKLAEDMFAVPERLRCEHPDLRTDFEVDDPRGGLMAACADLAGTGGDMVKVRVSNQHAFPMLVRPTGMTVEPPRVLQMSYSDHVLRRFAEHRQPGTLLLPGGEQRTFVARAGQQPQQLAGNVDFGTVGAEVALYLAGIVVSELRLRKAPPSTWEKLDKNLDMLEALDCVTESLDEGDKAPSVTDWLGTVVRECVPVLLDELSDFGEGLIDQLTEDKGIKGVLRKAWNRPINALQAALDGSKVIPRYVEALMVAGFRVVGEKEATRPARIRVRRVDPIERLANLLPSQLGLGSTANWRHIQDEGESLFIADGVRWRGSTKELLDGVGQAAGLDEPTPTIEGCSTPVGRTLRDYLELDRRSWKYSAGLRVDRYGGGWIWARVVELREESRQRLRANVEEWAKCRISTQGYVMRLEKLSAPPLGDESFAFRALLAPRAAPTGFRPNGYFVLAVSGPFLLNAQTVETLVSFDEVQQVAAEFGRDLDRALGLGFERENP
jgi:hypothetical protein